MVGDAGIELMAIAAWHSFKTTVKSAGLTSVRPSRAPAWRGPTVLKSPQDEQARWPSGVAAESLLGLGVLRHTSTTRPLL